MRKIAAIDIGSNAVRMLICYILKNENEFFFQKNQYVRLPLRLGEDSFKTGIISDDKINTLSNALQSFKFIMKVHGVEKYQIYATSALRDSINSSDIINQIYDSTGMKIKLINGIKEAKLIAKGNPIKKLDFDKTYLYVDVGGGSTEYSIIRRGYNKKSKSFNIGTVRLINNFVDESIFDEIKKWISKHIEDDIELKVLATGGNINKIQDMTRTKPDKPISYLSIKYLYNNLLEKDITERMIKYDLNPDRADVIIPALKIFISTMEWANTNKLFVPKAGLVDGMIWEIHNSIN
ncbi:MAG: exopolyphosphatase [Bacteroidetes bacterium]|nr:exopolyphosphatase [Cryomorphaceae bacterium]MBL6677350.1 exopolyphosphatase [Flavobacteriaceae bacterium]MDA0330355.1 exopolyphosphatase [Bacteroidota bacterium]MDA0884907.1 exopolyphosphatase [Bacteroidota bacterium]MDA1225967.1 exopolyphosphatase [Bacteroidota bacterium]